MPARTKRCLDPAFFHKKIQSNSCRATGRRLHSSFWSHGAQSLPCSLWWDEILVSMSRVFLETSKNARGITNERRQGRYTHVLDFLYPRTTVALVESWSRSREQALHTRSRVALRREHLRHYSSIAQPSMIDDAIVQPIMDGQASFQIRKTKTTTSAQTSNPVQDDVATLKRYLEEMDWIDVRLDDNNTSGQDSGNGHFAAMVRDILPSGQNLDFDQVWDAFNDMPKAEQTVNAKIMLANYLSFSNREADSIRLLFLTNNEIIETSFPVWRAIAVRLFAGDLYKAAEIHEAAQRQNIRSYIGSDLLLAHAIQVEDWKLALRISTTIFNNLERPYDKAVIRKSIHDLWAVTTRLPNLRGLLSEFLAFAYERLDLQYFVIKAFVSHFLLAALSRVPQTTSGLEIFLTDIQKYSVDERPLLQFALERIIATLKEPWTKLDARLFGYVKSIWDAYRKYCGPGDIEIPIIHGLLEIMTRPQYAKTVPAEELQNLVLDILSVCSARNVPMPYEIMVYVMQLYAVRGNVEMVRYINTTLTPQFREMNRLQRSESEREADQRRAYALMLVHATRGEVAEMEEVFARLRAINSKVQTWERLWRMLIRIYVRQARYSQIFDILFRRMVEAGCPPRAKTFGIVLRKVGLGGHVAVVSRLLDIAKEQGIALGVHMISSLASAHIARGDHDAGEEIHGLMEDYQAGLGFEDTYISVERLLAANRVNDFPAAEAIYRQVIHSGRSVHPTIFFRMVDMYTRNHQTDLAIKVVFDDMPQHDVQADTNIYGLLIRGLWHEMRYKEAVAMFDRIPQSHGLPSVTCCEYWLAALVQLSRQYPTRDSDVLAGLRALTNGEYKDAPWLRHWPISWHSAPRDVYFSSLIERFAEVAAWDIVNYLQNWYLELNPSEPPLAVLKALMKANTIAGNHDEVNVLFERALSRLSRDVRVMADDLNSFSVVSDTQSQLANGEEKVSSQSADATEQLDSEIEALVSDPSTSRLEMPYIGTAFDLRNLTQYIILDHFTSLTEQGRFDDIIQAMSRLQTLGFAMPQSYRMWNHFVQCLCKSSEPRHIITAFRTSETRLYSKWAIHRDLNSAEDRRLLVLAKTATRRDEIKVEARTMLMLKEVALAAIRTSIENVALSSDLTSHKRRQDYDEPSTIALSSILSQVAPRMFPAVMDWRGVEYVYNQTDNDYFRTPLQQLASRTRQLRNEFFAKTTEEIKAARRMVYGPPESLKPFSSLHPAGTAVSSTTGSQSIDENASAASETVNADDMLSVLMKAADSEAHPQQNAKADWASALYEAAGTNEVEVAPQLEEPLIELGYDAELYKQTTEEKEKTSVKAAQAPDDSLERLYAGLRQGTALKKGERHWAKK